MRRRDFLASGGALIATTSALPSGSFAQARYPARPVHLIVPSQAGGVYDLMGRIWAEKAGSTLGTIVVENRAGGSATVGVAAAAKMAPDGYSILLASNATHILQPAMMSQPPYDPVKDFTVVAALTASWTAIVVSAALPVKSVRELIAYAKDNPGKLNFGYAGVGDTTHIAGELFKQLGNGLQIVGVPYRGMTPAIRELASGHLHMGMPHVTGQITEMHKTGQIRVLAINAPTRVPVAPEVPTAAEEGLPDMTAATVFYLFAPAGTPRPILERLNAATGEALADEAFKKRLIDAGFDPLAARNLDDTQQFLAKEYERWVPIAQATGIKIN